MKEFIVRLEFDGKEENAKLEIPGIDNEKEFKAMCSYIWVGFVEAINRLVAPHIELKREKKKAIKGTLLPK